MWTLMLGDCSWSPEDSYLHLGLLSVSVSSSADYCREEPGTRSSPDSVPGTAKGQVSPPPSVDVTAIRAHTLGQHRVYKAGSGPKRRFQRYPVKVMTLNLMCLKIQTPRHSVIIHEQRAGSQRPDETAKAGSRKAWAIFSVMTALLENIAKEILHTPGHTLKNKQNSL